MPKTADFIHAYSGPLETPGQCRIRVYRLSSGVTVVIATELPHSAPSVSITNVAELLATQMRRLFVLSGGAMVWIEHDLGPPEVFERVLFRWDGREYIEPEWHESSRAQVEGLIGEVLE